LHDNHQKYKHDVARCEYVINVMFTTHYTLMANNYHTAKYPVEPKQAHKHQDSYWCKT